MGKTSVVAREVMRRSSMLRRSRRHVNPCGSIRREARCRLHFRTHALSA